MAKLNTDSPIARRIVRSFLDFLNSVEPAPGVDVEGLEVARECLTEAFKLESFSVGDAGTKSDSLIDIFRSLEVCHDKEKSADLTHKEASVNVPSSSSLQSIANSDFPEGEDRRKEPNAIGVSKDELFGQFFAALEKIDFVKTMPDVNDDSVFVDKASRIFHDALNEMERSGCEEYSTKTLAEALKCQGNRAMQSKLYSDAIELYSFAIALCEKNAVYYSNRAAAYTQLHKYTEAIRDSRKSIEIDPNYSKAYSRLGLAYYAQGNYSDAIEKGFKKALQLDPNNESVKENIRVAEQKLREEREQTRRDQGTSSSHNNQESNNHQPGWSRSHQGPPPFTMPFNINTSALPTDFASVLMNMTANAYQGQPSQNREGDEGTTANESDGPEVRIGGNINLDFGEQMPEELTEALRSVMDMFSGASRQQNPDGSANGRSAAD